MSELLLAAEREVVAGASRHLAEEGLVIGTAGNISARLGDLIAVTPTGSDLGTLTAEMITVIDLGGQVVDGDLAPTSEVPLHTGIYAATNACAITHAHAMASTALSCCHDELPALHYSAFGIGRHAPHGSLRHFWLSRVGRQCHRSTEGAKRRHDAEPRVRCLRLNYGSGHTPPRASRMAGRAVLASLLDGDPHVLTDKDFEAIITAAIERGYGGLKRVDKS